jgi:peptidoglycan/xylan/chitin deacetylase (PgdA/CDA1 family)
MAGASRSPLRILKLVISVLFWFCICVWQFVRRLSGSEVSGSCVILYYHSIPAEYRLRFASQMDKLARLTRPVKVDAVPPLLPGLRYSAVTFDDAFENIFDNALPELFKRNIPATVFVPADLLEQRATWWPIGARERHERISTAQRLRELPADLTTIGSHTLTHPKLPMLGIAEAERELRLSKAQLEGMLKRKVGTFSFPYGAFDENLVTMCRTAGYERVFTTLPQMAFSDPAEFVTGRVGVEPTDWGLEFYLKLMGAYRWLPYAFSLKRSMLGRAS